MVTCVLDGFEPLSRQNKEASFIIGCLISGADESSDTIKEQGDYLCHQRKKQFKESWKEMSTSRMDPSGV